MPDYSSGRPSFEERPSSEGHLTPGADGIVVLGHGSRAPQAGELLEWVARKLGERLACPVMAASLQFNRPNLEECCHRLAEAGASRIVVAPYFLFKGNHMQQDIPGELAALEKQLPGVRIILADPLGADERLVEVIRQRVAEAAGTEAELQRVAEAAGDKAEFFETALETYPAAGGEAPLPAHPIEQASFAIIDSLLGRDPQTGGGAVDPEYEITRRVIHATGDLSMARSLVFSPAAAGAGVQALARGADIICDVNMAAVGIRPSAARMGLSVRCAVADEETVRLAAAASLTRAAAGMRRLAAGGGLDGSVVAIGNAPSALFEVLRLAGEEGVRPALVIGVPVGFVGAAESKEALVESGLPHISLPGNRGGSNIAVAAVNALLRLTARKK